MDKIVQSVREQLPTKLDETLEAQKNKLERLGMTALSIFGLGLFGLLIYLVGYKLMLTQGKVLAGLAILGFIVLIGSGLLSVILFAKANELKDSPARRPDELGESLPTANLLNEAQVEPVPTVTERTTELLFAKGNTKK
ncbi:MAG: hypothetical protein LC794_14945 [Acidobacteria bacterium]|nr:hypothetical protein [Acidobacteriota bacterium]MCA1627970.1 hypothetical protein [Acidobacteriota bacterium]